MGCRCAGRPPAISDPGGRGRNPGTLPRGPGGAGGCLSLLRRAGPGEPLPLLPGGGLSPGDPAPAGAGVPGADGAPPPATPSSRGRTAPRCPSWPRRSWRGWAGGAATACGSCPPTAPMCFWGPSSPTCPWPPRGPGRGPSAPRTAGPARPPAPPGPWGREGATCPAASPLVPGEGGAPPGHGGRLGRSPTIWGCDLCQGACPHNRAAALSPLPEFREDLILSLTREDLAGLSGKAFRRAYGRRAFAWRGVAPLRRNLGLPHLPKKAPPRRRKNRRRGQRKPHDAGGVLWYNQGKVKFL